MTSTEPKVHGLYFDLDALLDTRMASLFLVHDALVGAALDGGYLSRMEDNFAHLHPALTKAKFKELYDGRNNEVLHNAAFTKGLHVLRDAVHKLYQQMLQTPYTKGMVIYLNTYPYTLDDEEEEAIAKTLMHYAQGAADIQFIRMSNAELTPGHCDRSYSLMVRYEYGEWLDMHAKTNALKRTPLTTMTLLVPELFFARLPNTEEKARMVKGQFDPFKSIETTWSSIVGIRFLPIDTFSVDVENAWKPLLQAVADSQPTDPTQ